MSLNIENWKGSLCSCLSRYFFRNILLSNIFRNRSYIRYWKEIKGNVNNPYFVGSFLYARDQQLEKKCAMTALEVRKKKIKDNIKIKHKYNLKVGSFSAKLYYKEERYVQEIIARLWLNKSFIRGLEWIEGSLSEFMKTMTLKAFQRCMRIKIIKPVCQKKEEQNGFQDHTQIPFSFQQ